MSPFQPEPEKVRRVREMLPATGAGIYLATASAGPLPRETALAMGQVEERELLVGRGDAATREDARQRREEARAAVAAIVGARIDRVAVTDATTGGLVLAAWGLGWRPGDRALVTTLEDASAVGPLLAIRERFGVAIDVVDVGDGDDAGAVIGAVERALTPATRLVVVSHVSPITGARLPVRPIADAAHARGALVAVDGSQAAGAIPVDVESLGADVYSTVAHTWLLGPEGLGGAVIGPDALERLAPIGGTPDAFATADAAAMSRHFRGDARRHDAGGVATAALVGLARSCGWISMYVGLPWIHERSARLARAAHDRLAALPGVRLLTGSDVLATVVVFLIEGWPAADALDELGQRAYLIADTVPGTDAIRLAPAFFTTDEELDRLVDAVSEVARHTPGTLPPRSTLPILGQ